MRTAKRNLLVVAVAVFLCAPAGCRDDRDQKIESLRQKYAGTIRTDLRGPEIGKSVQQMDRLMTEWDPVDYRRAHVEALLGKPTEESKEAMVYRFDSGLGGWQWRFNMRDGVVSSVEKSSLE